MTETTNEIWINEASRTVLATLMRESETALDAAKLADISVAVYDLLRTHPDLTKNEVVDVLRANGRLDRRHQTHQAIGALVERELLQEEAGSRNSKRYSVTEDDLHVLQLGYYPRSWQESARKANAQELERKR